jgi:hypothetical protein
MRQERKSTMMASSASSASSRIGIVFSTRLMSCFFLLLTVSNLPTENAFQTTTQTSFARTTILSSSSSSHTNKVRSRTQLFESSKGASSSPAADTASEQRTTKGSSKSKNYNNKNGGNSQNAKGKVRGENRRPTNDNNNRNNNNNNNNNKRPYSKSRNNYYKKKGPYSPPPNRRLNQEIVKCETAQEVLQCVASQKGALSTFGGGGKLNSVNFSTAVHRLAKHLMYNNYGGDDPKNNDANRAKVLSDPRFALLLCSTAEAIDNTQNIQLGDANDGSNHNNNKDEQIVFNSREMSNIAWALAKYKIVPPQRVMPVDVSSTSIGLLQEKSKEVRLMVYQVAKERAAEGESPGGYATTWLPGVSQLCGHLLDYISSRVIEIADSNQFQLQEFANLLWALATTQRADERIFSFVTDRLMRGMETQIVQSRESEGLRPQEWSNSIWALATSGISGPEEELLPFVADLMDKHPEFVAAFKPQELSNTAWGVATILSKRSSTRLDCPASDAALRIFRNVAKQLIARQGEGYKTQELTNSVWAFATLGFGLPISASARFISENRSTDYTFLKSDDEEGDKELMESAVRIVTDQAIHKQMRYFRSQELNNVAWAMHRLNQRDDQLLNMIGKELANTKRPVTSQVGKMLYPIVHGLYYPPRRRRFRLLTCVFCLR